MLRKVTLFAFALALFSSLNSVAQVSVVIGNGTTGNYLFGPIYRSSATSGFDFCQYSYLFDQDELPIPTGAIITEIEWFKLSSAETVDSAYFNIWMENSADTVLNASTAWADAINGATWVYSDSGQMIPATVGWLSFKLDSSLVYNGGNLQISTSWNISDVVGSPTTGGFDWMFEQKTGMAIGNASSTYTTVQTLGSSSYSNSRPNVRITYIPPQVIDCGIANILSPGSVLSAGTSDFNVNLTNYGGIDLDSAMVYGSITDLTTSNSTAFGPVNWTGGPLSAANSSTSINLGSYTFTSGSFEIKAWTSMPNGTADADASNDTLTRVGCTALAAGTYTIDANQATAGTNFNSFSSAINSLVSCGISGPIVLDVVTGSGPYNEQIEIAEISGTSPTNTVTIQGNGETIAFGSADSDKRAVIKLDGADYIIIDSLNIDATGGTYGWGVHLINSADNNTITNSWVITDTSSTSSTNFNGIVASNSNTSATSSGNNANSLSLLNNTVIGGYYGIRMNGTNSSTLSTANQVRNNTLSGFYYYGLYAFYQDGIKVHRNVFRARNSSSTSSRGTYFSNCDNDFELTANTIYNVKNYGMYLATCNQSMVKRGLVANNMIGGRYQSLTTSTTYGIYFSNVESTDVWYNSVLIDRGASASGTTSGSKCFYVTGTTSSDLDIRNNSFANISGGYALYVGTASVLTALEGNNYYAVNGYLAYYDGTALTDLAALQADPAGPVNHDSKSREGNPGYADTTDLHASSASTTLNGGASPVGIAVDFDGEVRDLNNPDIGADEFTPPPNDVGVSAINSPSVPLSIGANDFAVTFSNFGGDVLDSVTLHGSATLVGSGTTTSFGPLTWISGPLASGAQAGPIVLGSVNIVAGTYELKAWTSGPNGAIDIDASNDTLSTTVCTALSGGTYTIDQNQPTGGTNFNSFNDAVSAMTECGVAGAVTLDVVTGSGPYWEQVEIGSIIGVNANNPLTIQGNNEVITYSSGNTNARAVFKLSEIDHVTVDGLQIIATNDSTYGWAVLLQQGADTNTFVNCRIETDTVSTSSTNFNALVASASNTSASTSGDNANQLTIDNCEIVGGYYGVRLNGVSTSLFAEKNTITNCTFSGQYIYGAYMYRQNSPTVANNHFSSRVSRSSSARAVYFSNVTGGFDISSNIVQNVSQYGFYFTTVNQTGTERGLVSNNMIGGKFSGTGTTYGLYFTNTDRIDVWHNSILLDNGSSATGTSTGSRSIYLSSSCDGFDIRNNSFANTAGGYALYILTPGTQVALDANNYYTTGSWLAYYGSVAMADLAALRADIVGPANHDSKSRAGAPGYLSDTDLHAQGVQMNNAGLPIADVTTDIDGELRSTVAPDMGADEYTPPANDVGVSAILTPNGSIATDTVDFIVDVTNFGAANVDSFMVAGMLMSADQSTMINVGPVSYSANILVPGASSGPITLGRFFLPQGTYDVSAWTMNPNGNADADVSNDTLNTAACSALPSGFYTVDANSASSNTNFTSFNELAGVLSTCGINGTVIINVVAGSGPYNEQVTFNEVGGASSSSTVTINGNGETLHFAPSTGNARHIVKFDGADHITLSNLNIQVDTGSTYGWGIHFINAADTNSIKNCTIISDTVSTSNTAFMGIVASNSSTSASNSGNNANALTIDGCNVVGGYYGIRLNGTSSTVLAGSNIVTNNTVTASHIYGVYLLYQDAIKVNGNRISNRTAPSTSARAIYLSNVDNDFEVSNNVITNVSQHGMYFVACNNTATKRARIANNMIGGGYKNSGTTYGIYCSTVKHIDIWHNSVWIDAGSAATGTSSGSRAFYLAGTSEFIDLRNNSFACGSGGYPLYVVDPVDLVALDHNNYYSTSPYVAYYDGSPVPDLAALISDPNGPTNHDFNSREGNPNYYDNLDLHANGAQLDGGAAVLASFGTDIDDEPRSLTAPDIGADEFVITLFVDIAVDALVEPQSACGLSSAEMVTIALENDGFDTLLAGEMIDVSVMVSGSTQTETVTLSGAFLPGDTIHHTFANAVDLSDTGLYQFMIWLSNVEDTFNMNDTAMAEVENLFIPDAPMVTGTYESFGPAAFLIPAMANADFIQWFDSAQGGNLVSREDTFDTGLLTSSQTFYVEAATGTSESTGLPAPIGTSGFLTTPDWGLIFQTEIDVTLEAVHVYPEGTGQIVIAMLDNQTETILEESAPFQISGASGNRIRVPLGFTAAGGGDYRLVLSSYTGISTLYRDVSAPGFPFVTSGGELTISGGSTGSSSNATTYYWFYEWEVSVSGCSSERTAVEVLIEDSCRAPMNLMTTNITNSSATFNWMSPLGGDHYVLQGRPAGASSWLSVPVNGTSFNANGLTPNSDYEWRVMAYCDSAETLGSPYSAIVSFSTLPNCVAPSNLTTSAITMTGATMTWDAVSNATGYVVRGKPIGAGSWTVANSGNNSLSPNVLQPGVTYIWQVRAECSNPNSTSAYSELDTFTTATCVAPDSLETINITHNAARLTWQQAPFATSYTLRGRRVGTGNWTVLSINSGGTSGLNAPGLSPNTSYEWQIRSHCGSSSSPFAPLTTFTTLVAPPKADQSAFGVNTDLDIEVFPNPSNGLFNLRISGIEDQQVSLTVNDMQGRTVYSTETASGFGRLETAIDLSGVAQGVYLLNISIDGKQEVRRLSVK